MSNSDSTVAGFGRQRYFQLMKITATSTHPVRNTKNQLIVGDHTLWDSANPSLYKDGKQGSLQPNLFGYDFGSASADVGFLKVTVQSRDADLTGVEAFLIGSVGGKEVIKSDYFLFKGKTPVPVNARLVLLKSMTKPFLLNADVDWGVKLRSSSEKVQRYGEGVTRLELYWIAKALHPAFKNSIPLSFLRLIVKADPKGLVATHSTSLGEVTDIIFGGFHKRYDVTAGASRFNMGFGGGNFALSRYLDPATDAQNAGRSFPTVNCMDQAGALELACSFERQTGWLGLAPFGYINSTHLVGVMQNNNLINVNNPFFEDRDADHRPEVPINAEFRSGFGCHVFNCHSRAWTPEGNEGIYDACGGPHRGTENIQQYITNSIDHVTTLYERDRRNIVHDHGDPYDAGPGAPRDVRLGPGVGQIDGPPIYMAESQDKHDLPPALSQLAQNVAANPTHPVAYIDWARLDTWVKPALGEMWEIQYKEVSVGNVAAQAFWHLINANSPDDSIRVDVHVFSVVTQDGRLDNEASAEFVKKHVNGLLFGTQRVDAWTSGTLEGIGAYLKYDEHIPAGRLILVVGHVIIDIGGLASTDALLPHILKLFTRSAPHSPKGPGGLPPVIPVLRKQAHQISDSDVAALSETITVNGVHTPFSVVFSANRKIITARADSDGDGILFDQHVVKNSDEETGSEVTFFLITNNIGRHRVRVCVADEDTMLGASYDLEVEVVDA